MELTGHDEDFDARVVDVYLSGVFPTTDPIKKRARCTSSAAHYGIHGTLTQLLAGNLTAAVVTSASGNTQAIVTAVGLGAAHVGKLIVLTVSGAVGIIGADLGGGTVQIVDLRTFVSNSRLAHVFTPVGNETFVVYDYTAVGAVDLSFHSSIQNGGGVWPPPFIVENISSTSNSSFNGEGWTFEEVLVRQCAFQDVQATSGPQLFRNCYFNLQTQSNLSGFPTTKLQCCWLAAAPTATGYNLGQGGQVDLGLSNSDANVVAHGAVTVSWGVTQTEGLLGIFSTQTSSFGGLRIYGRAAALRLHSSNIYGVSTSPYAIAFERGACLWKLGPTTNIYATGATSSFAVGGANAPFTTTLMPSIMASAGGSLPALAACTTMTQLNSSPFNGEAHDYGSGSWMGVEPA